MWLEIMYNIFKFLFFTFTQKKLSITTSYTKQTTKIQRSNPNISNYVHILFRNKRFMLDEMFQHKALEFVIHFEYKKH